MNNLVKKFKNEKKWVNWQYKTVDGKQTKIPLGKSNDPSTWSYYDDLPNHEHVGIMFGTDKKFLGIDIDHCLNGNEITHPEKETILRFIQEANTYTEISPSGTGLHLYFELSEPLELITNKKAPYEVYSAYRFFTVTGKSTKTNREVRTITPEEATKLLSIIGYPWGKDIKDASTTQFQNNIHTTSTETTIDDQEIINKMVASKNGDKIKRLYDGDTSDYQFDDSNADAALCAHLAFWTRKDATQMERIWLASPLGQRQKTQNRQDYRTRTIEHAIKNCKEVYKETLKTKVITNINEDEKEEIEFDFLYTTSGKTSFITLCVENIVEFLRKHPLLKKSIRLDTFKNYIEIKDNNTWRQIQDVDVIDLQARISRLLYEFQKVSKMMTLDAIVKIAKENQIDSAKEYVLSLTWDNVPRIDTWLCEAYGVEDTEYHRKVGSNWLKGLIQRIMQPGCKFDYVLVLEGEQGTRKSTSLATLGGSWYLETTTNVDSKDFFLSLQGIAIAEFSEGETLSRSEVKKMKSVISTQIDTYRAPYDKFVANHPRRCVFAMTTNEKQYLKDNTGNRRWLPVETKLGKINVEWIAENREQLFAEAYHRVITLQETTWEFPEEAKEMQESRMISDPDTELITNWYFDTLTQRERDEGITVLQVHIKAKGNEFNKSMKKHEEMNIANVLKNVLKLVKKKTMRNNVETIRWFPSGTVESDYFNKEMVGENSMVEDF